MMEETKNSIHNKFTSIAFENDVSNKNRMQAAKDYLLDAEKKEKEYDPASWAKGIFSYEDESPIENWLCNSIERMVGSTINMPTNWMQMTMERIDKERIYILVAAFQF